MLTLLRGNNGQRVT